MSITLRLLLGFFMIVGLAGWFVMDVFVDEVKPGVRQTMEEILVDTAHLLAELAHPDQQAQINTQAFARAFQRYRSRNPQAHIWGFEKQSLDLRVYITDRHGIVIYDSQDRALGQDYSHWNDVYLTLRGEYGVRSSLQDKNNPHSGVMYVAAPILQHKQLLGVLTVGKPTSTVQPFIDRSIQRIEQAGFWLLGSSLLVGLLITWRLTRAIGRLRRYARDVSLGQHSRLPRTRSKELDELALALAEMREKLDGREYIENYVHHLIHEMKSPLTALRGAAELLDEDMPRDTRHTFVGNIREQSRRLQDMLDKLLLLAKVEHRTTLENPETLGLQQLIDTVIADHAPQLQQRQLQCHNQLPAKIQISGEAFLLRQALSNLLDNAIDFSPAHSEITFTLQQQQLIIRDHGAGIPDYALPHLFERFYSLNRPNSQRKSTGLGLPFVKQVVQLHGWEVTLSNHPDGGVEAKIHLTWEKTRHHALMM